MFLYRLSNNWKPGIKERATNRFKKDFDKSMIIRNKLIEHLKSQEAIGIPTDGYVLEGHTFCVSYFSHLTGISKFIISTTLKDFWKGLKLYTHLNSGVIKQQTAETSQFIAWLKSYCELNGQFSPEVQQIILSHWLNKGCIESDKFVSSIVKIKIYEC